MLSVGHIPDRMQVFSLTHSATSNRTRLVDVSTSYVHRLHSYGSPSSSTIPTPRNEFPGDLEHAAPSPKFANRQHLNPEQAPLIGARDSHCPPSDPHLDRSSLYGALNGGASEYFEGHHRHEPRNSHLSHHERTRPTTMYGPGEFSQGQPSDVPHVHHVASGHHHQHMFEDTEDVTDTHEHHFHHHIDGHEDFKVGKKRQIVGILVRFRLICRLAHHSCPSRYYN